MNSYKISPEEKAYLENYDINQYERPSVATDIAIFSVMEDGESDNFRKLPEKALKILLIKRGTYPYKDCWALPGGFCRPDEDVCDTARRELYEETNVKNAYLQAAGIFGEVGRDPRGWIISNTFLALVDGATCNLKAGTDAWEAKWFSINLKEEECRRRSDEDRAEVETKYSIQLTHEASQTQLSIKVKEYKIFENYHETVKFEILDAENIAFDHAKIILHAILTLRRDVERDSKLVFDLMPEVFTLSALQKALELVLDQKLLTANFRRKIADYVVETEHIIEGAGHRPAKLYKRNVEAFYK